MPDEIHNQSQTIDDLILDILANETQIIRCLRVFFCETLQEIADAKCISAERKVKLATELISSAAQKEAALAAVLEAISKFEFQCPSGWLSPGDCYIIDLVPDRNLYSITVRWEDGGTAAFGTLYIDDVPYQTSPVSDLPDDYTWMGLDYYPTTESTQAWIEISGGCVNILGLTVEYKEPPVEWIPIAPGASYPLPTEPAEISKITFEGKTDPGKTSLISLLKSGLPTDTKSVDENASTINFSFSTAPSNTFSLKNTGDSTIYIRNLTTE